MQDRRDFIRTLGVVALGFSGLRLFAKSNEGILGAKEATGYGDLYETEDGILKLPKGFEHKVIAEHGQKMSDGFYLPGRPDGMGTFKGSTKDKVIIVMNHENSQSQALYSPFGSKYDLLSKIQKEKLFDYGYGKKPHAGGTTTHVYNEKTQKIEKQFLSLTGTSRNCAGGVTPWGSWLTCEEDFKNKNEEHESGHGYVFEVPAQEKTYVKYPVPIRAMGKFNHEAVAVDAKTGIVYLTEDRHEGLFYRFIPKKKEALHKGGTLQALAFVWKEQMDTRNWESITLKEDIPYAVRWITLTDVDGEKDDLRIRGWDKGAACFARGEGIWAADDAIYFACTNGGERKLGQIFKYIPSKYEGEEKEKNKDYYPRLELYAEPNDSSLLRYCDNLTIAPWGDVVFCEDHRSGPRISGITPEGKFYKIAQNIGHPSEFAGVCFSPSGKTLFVNIQEVGKTLAITGDWDKRKV